MHLYYNTLYILPMDVDGLYNHGPKMAVSATVIRDSIISVTVFGGRCDITEIML